MRLLATFRAVYTGIEHETLRLPGYGGDLFNPDRFPFLEGRTAAEAWTEHASDPLPVNNRVILHLLEALQILRVKVANGGEAEPRRLSSRALDIEQIGHVYKIAPRPYRRACPGCGAGPEGLSRAGDLGLASRS